MVLIKYTSKWYCLPYNVMSLCAILQILSTGWLIPKWNWTKWCQLTIEQWWPSTCSRSTTPMRGRCQSLKATACLRWVDHVTVMWTSCNQMYIKSVVFFAFEVFLLPLEPWTEVWRRHWWVKLCYYCLVFKGRLITALPRFPLPVCCNL